MLDQRSQDCSAFWHTQYSLSVCPLIAVQFLFAPGVRNRAKQDVLPDKVIFFSTSRVIPASCLFLLGVCPKPNKLNQNARAAWLVWNSKMEIGIPK